MYQNRRIIQQTGDGKTPNRIKEYEQHACLCHNGTSHKHIEHIKHTCNEQFISNHNELSNMKKCVSG